MTLARPMGWLVAVLVWLAAATPGRGLAQGVDPPDTYADAGSRALVERARAARDRDVEGIESYEGVLRQRIYVGLTALSFRRERGLFEHERVARIRWSSSGDRVIQWIGVRTAIPIAGIDTRNPDGPGAALSMTDSSAAVGTGGRLQQDMAGDLLDETDMPAFDFDPGAIASRSGATSGRFILFRTAPQLITATRPVTPFA